MFNYSVRVNKLSNPKSKLVGFGDLIIDDTLVVKGWKFFEGPRGVFVKPPSHPGKDKEGKDTYFDDVLFDETKDPDTKMGPVQAEIYQEMLNAYAAAGTTQKPPANDRGTAAKRQSEATTRRTPPAKQQAANEYW